MPVQWAIQLYSQDDTNVYLCTHSKIDYIYNYIVSFNKVCVSLEGC